MVVSKFDTSDNLIWTTWLSHLLIFLSKSVLIVLIEVITYSYNAFLSLGELVIYNFSNCFWSGLSLLYLLLNFSNNILYDNNLISLSSLPNSDSIKLSALGESSGFLTKCSNIQDLEFITSTGLSASAYSNNLYMLANTL